MNAKKQPVNPDIDEDLASAKIKRSTLELVKAYKKETYMPIHVFIDNAVRNELKRLKRLK